MIGCELASLKLSCCKESVLLTGSLLVILDLNHNSNKIKGVIFSLLTLCSDVEFLSPKRKCDFTLVPMDRRFHLCYIGEVWNALTTGFFYTLISR